MDAAEAVLKHGWLFYSQFFRCRGLLHFVAGRVLDSRKEAEEAVQNCLLTALRTFRRFESEGAFRSWLLRILIDEALQILRQRKNSRLSQQSPDVLHACVGV